MRKWPPLSLGHNYDAVCLRYLPKVNQNSRRPWVRVRSPEQMATTKTWDWEWLWELQSQGSENANGYCLSLEAGVPQTKTVFRVRI